MAGSERRARFANRNNILLTEELQGRQRATVLKLFVRVSSRRPGSRLHHVFAKEACSIRCLKPCYKVKKQYFDKMLKVEISDG